MEDPRADKVSGVHRQDTLQLRVLTLKGKITIIELRALNNKWVTVTNFL